MTQEVPTLTTNFAVHRGREGYGVRGLFPRLGGKRHMGEGGTTANVSVRRVDMEHTLNEFQRNAQEVGLELGQNDPSIRLLRVTGVGMGSSRRDPHMEPGSALMQIKDEFGNDIRFRLVNQPGFVDGAGRQWDSRVVARVERAVVNGREVELTPEMTHSGFVFLTQGMPGILQSTREGGNPTMTIRQETPDAICFIDGHHTFAGNHNLGCYCKEEREASLAIIHERGGVSSLMPGTGNGNGSEAQDIQTSVRYNLARQGGRIPAYTEIYNRMGLEGDDRHDTLNISTIIMQHLFQADRVTNITTLTESRTKQEVWHKFGGKHTVTGVSLGITPPDHLDSLSKQSEGRYVRADQAPFPLQPRA